MSFTYLNQLPTPAQIKEEFPLSEALRRIKEFLQEIEPS